MNEPDALDRLRDREDVEYCEEVFELDADGFETVREAEEAGVEASVGALVRDGEGRIALVRNHWSDGWILPGGKADPDESLREAAVREIREETGLEATVERPLEVIEQEYRHGDKSLSGHFVVFEALADDSSFGETLGEIDDLGENDVEIEDAAWFDGIPEECEDEDRLRRHL